MSNKILEPYRRLFKMGMASALLGILFWVAFRYRMLSFYPKESHANVMYFAFLWSFIAGFLMTAIPKMTQAAAATEWEKRSAEVFVLLQVGLAFFNKTSFAVGLFLLQNIFLLLFVSRRFMQRQQLPFEGFVFLPFGFVASFLGVYLFFAGTSNYGPFYPLAGEAFVLNLICGIGSRLIPVLSRLPQALEPTQAGTSYKTQKMLLMALWLNASFYVTLIGADNFSFLLRGSFLAFHSVYYFRFFQRPAIKTYVGMGLKISMLFLMAGYFLSYLRPEWTLPFMHLTYIGGLALLTILVATRVTLAHGGAGLEAELHSKVILLTILGLGLSAILRSWAQFNVTGLALLCSVFLFILGFMAWSWRFARLLK